ncbi:MAG: hypothetical protein LBP98_00980 [Tannerella sp.]|jgi:hypothetical protein|nr:hypothetical protein [Tannerella sp.]
MAKKKKKVNLHAQQKLQAVQHKKLYMERLRKICMEIGNGESLFDLIPLPVREAIYENRGATLKIKVDKDVKITKRFVKIMYGHLEKEMKSKSIELMIPGMVKYVNLVDYYQLVLPLEGVLTSVYEFKGKEKFEAFCLSRDERYIKYHKELVYIIHCACYTYCDLSKRSLYTFTFNEQRSSNVIDHQSYTGIFYQIITLGLYPLDVRYVTIHGDRRPVVQTGEIDHRYNLSCLKPATVPLKRLHVKDPSGNTEIPIYVQQHAVNRTMQRACCVFPGTVPSLINKAFSQKRKIIREGSRYLIECYDNEIKIGYFVGMLVDNIFVILTFLLITHSSTPEGRKLSKLTGLQRSDISFLAIDDLKTLINSDISDDARIAQIFIEAGCESILNMNYQLHVFGDFEWLRDETKQNTELSKLIAEYIQMGDTDEEYFENE